jgi:hypothetical protein
MGTRAGFDFFLGMRPESPFLSVLHGDKAATFNFPLSTGGSLRCERQIQTEQLHAAEPDVAGTTRR